MTDKVFLDKDGKSLIVRNNKTNILLLADDKSLNGGIFLRYIFEEDVFKEIIAYIDSVSRAIWKDFTPKEATSARSDYDEYYDRKYDNNGYMSVDKVGTMRIKRPCYNCPYMYKLTKRITESFVYDFAV